MIAHEILEAFDALPRLGLIDDPSPITVVPAIADELGLDWLGIKRDDRIAALYGGSKIRKLDYLLASQPYVSAPTWASTGAIGSGHLVALTAAAEMLDRRLIAHVFWEPAIEEVVENLRFIASGPTEIHDHATRVHLALSQPSLLLAKTSRGDVVIPPGATAPAGVAGMVRGGVELAAQIERGEIPQPDVVYVALGSGGTAVGLSLGLALCGLPIPVRAVSAVERPFAPIRRMQDILREAREWLVERDIGLLPLAREMNTPVEIVHGWVGPGYGMESAASRAACAKFEQYEIPLDPLYSGKAMAALTADVHRHKAANVLFWLTPRRPGPMPHRVDWQERLPRSLRRKLDRPERRGLTRRHAMAAGVVALTGAGIWARTTGYPTMSKWRGHVLSAKEAFVLGAAAEALLPPAPDDGFEAIAQNVDRFLVGVTDGMQREVKAMLSTVEHATVIDGHVSRFSSLTPRDREAYLMWFGSKGGLRGQIYRGMRDLCMLGYYQQAPSWVALGYDGPWVEQGKRTPTTYDAMVAKPGQQPKGLIR